MILYRAGIVLWFYIGSCVRVACEASAQHYAVSLAQIYDESDYIVLVERYEANSGKLRSEFA